VLQGSRTILRGEGNESLVHAIELVSQLHSACGVLRTFFQSPHAKPFLTELDTFGKRARLAAALNVSDDDRMVADGPEKRKELHQRAAVAIKLLLQELCAPGKRD